MNERASCTECVHRRGITSMEPNYTVCHYLLDTGEPRGCPPECCTHWQSKPKSFEQWVSFIEGVKGADRLE
ncbi:MAG: hypothetical protein RRY54_06410 [Angelakisella sp.]